MTADDWIRALALEPHPEGGHYRETYRAGEFISGEGLPIRFGGARALSTAIYFLLKRGEVSVFHRLHSDEVWHHYAGGPLLLWVLHPDRRVEQLRLGVDPTAGEYPQVTIPAGWWFGAEPEGPAGFSLVGCTVAPGFDFADFEIASRGELLARYPEHVGLIAKLTRPAML